MRRLAFICAIAWAIGAHAESASDWKSISCADLSIVLSTVSGWRDGGYSPQQTYKQMKHDPNAMRIKDGQLKAMINAAYFDPDLSQIPARQMSGAVFQACENPPKQYTPLQ